MGRATGTWIAHGLCALIVISGLIPTVLASPAAAAQPDGAAGSTTALKSSEPQAAEPVPFAATTTLAFTVNDLGDAADAATGNGICETAPGNHSCTLRAAIQEADAAVTTAGVDANVTITFGVGGTITLGSVIQTGLGTPLGTGTRTMTIDGCPTGGPCNAVRIDGAGATQLLHFEPGPAIEGPPSRLAVTIAHVTLANGSAANGGGLFFRGDTLNVNAVTFEANHATSNGGALYVYTGSVSVTNTTFQNNTASIALATDGGGSVYTANQSDAPAAVVNLTNVTISSSETGSPLYSGGGNLFLYNSIVSSAGFACTTFLGIIGGDHNLTSDATGCAGHSTYNPSLGLTSYGLYGGVTPTIPAAATSPARGAGASCPGTDQRGLVRAVACDLGATEFSGITRTTLTSSTNPSSFLSSVAFTATVAAIYLPSVPSGTVEFRDGANVVATGVALDGSGRALLSTSSFTAGPHTVTAIFNATAPFAGSTSNPVSQQVNSQIASLSLTLSAPRYIDLGQTLSITAYVGGAVVAPTSGTVTFMEGGSALGSAPVGAFSTATLDVVGLSWGPHTITALYVGVYGTATAGAISVSARQSPAGMRATASRSPVVYGEAFTVRVAMDGVPGGPLPTGIVSAAASCAPLIAGQTSCSVSDRIPVGAQFVSLGYQGDDFYSTAFTTAPITVVKAASQIAVTLPTTLVGIGDEVTLTAKLSPVAPSVLLPDLSSGTLSDYAVDFYDGSALLGTGYFDGSFVATFTTRMRTGGNHALTARYGGASSHLGSTSPVAILAVAKARSVTRLIVDTGGNIAVGQPINLHAVVTYSVGPDTFGAQSGTVTILDGTTVIGSSGVAGNGEAWMYSLTLAPAIGCDLSALTCTHDLVARFEGTDDLSPSTSPLTQLVVQKGTVSLTLTASRTSFPYGTSVTLTATVRRVFGVGTPTGKVFFWQPGRPDLGTIDLDASGQATLTTTLLHPSVNRVMAYYYGDDSFLHSNEVTLPLQIGLIPTTVTVTTTPQSPSAIGDPVQVLAVVASGDGSAPGGTLTLSLNSAAVRVYTLANGLDRGAFTLPTTEAGAYYVSASYSGDDSHAASTALGFYHRIEQKNIHLTLTSDVSAPTLGQAVTLTARVSGLVPSFAPGTLTITRRDVNFVTTTLATPTVDPATGVATLALPAGLPAGSSHLVATIGGTPNYSSATASLDLAVGKPVPQITLAAGLAKVGEKQSVGITVYGLGAPPGDPRYIGLGLPKPTGRVTTSLNGPALTLLVAGTDYPLSFAFLDWTPQARGSTSVRVHYYGDDNYAEADLITDVPVAGCSIALASTLGGVTTAHVGDTVHAALTLTADTCGRPVAPSRLARLKLGQDDCAFNQFTATTTQTVGCDITLRKAGSLALTASYDGDSWYEPVAQTGSDSVFVRAGLLADASTGDWVAGDPVTVNWSVEGSDTGTVTISTGGGTTANCFPAPLNGSCTITYSGRSTSAKIAVTYRSTSGDVQTVEIAKPVLGCYTMSAQAGGDGRGTVTIDPPPNCAGTKWLEGTLVRFVATPDAHHRFAFWNADRTSLESRLDTQYVKVADRPVLEFANFEPICWKLQAFPERDSDGLGQLNVNTRGNCPNNFRDDMFLDGTVVAITAVPAATVTFGPHAGQARFFLEGWTGDASGSPATPTTTVTMTSDHTVNAVFDWPCQTLSLAATPSDKGTLTASPGPNCFGRSAGGQPLHSGYRPGTTVKLTATGLKDNFLQTLSLQGISAFPPVQTPTNTPKADQSIDIPYGDVTATAAFGSCVRLTLSVVKIIEGGHARPLFIDPPTADPKGNCPSPGLKDGWYLANTVVKLVAKFSNQNEVIAQANADYLQTLKDINTYYKNLNSAADQKQKQVDQDLTRAQRLSDIDTNQATLLSWSDGQNGNDFERTVTIGTKDMSLEAEYGSPGRCVSVPRRVEPAGAGTIVSDAVVTGCTGQGLDDDTYYDFQVNGGPAGASPQWVIAYAERNYDVNGAPPVWLIRTDDQPTVELHVYSKDVLRLPFYDPQYEVAAFMCYPVKLSVTQVVGSSRTTTSVPYTPGKVTMPYFDTATSACPLGGALSGSTLTFKAGGPPAGYDFVGFTGDGTKSADGKTLTVTANKALTIGIEYRVKCFTLSLDHVSKFDPAGNCPDGSGKYVGGTSVGLLAEDRGGDYVFRGWNGPVASQGRSTLVKVDTDLGVSPDYYHKDLLDKTKDFFDSTLPDVSADVGKKLIGALAATVQVAAQLEYGVVYALGSTLEAVGAYGHYLGIPDNVAQGIGTAGQYVNETANYMTVAATCLEEWAFDTPAASAVTQDVFSIASELGSPKNQYLKYAKRAKQVGEYVGAPLGDMVYNAANGGGLQALGDGLKKQADGAMSKLDDLAALGKGTTIPGQVTAAQSFDAEKFGLTMTACVANHAPSYLKDAVGTPK